MKCTIRHYTVARQTSGAALVVMFCLILDLLYKMVVLGNGNTIVL